jgi:hypothetical protein
MSEDGKTTGHVLAVVGLDGKGNADYLYDRSRSKSLPSAYASNEDYTRRQTEPRAEELDCRAVTPVSAYAFEQTNDDRARVADLVAEDLGMHRNDVLEALSKCKTGGEVVFAWQ